MTAVTADVRMAWTLLRGSDRREWWRVTLTGAGAALATGFALAAVVLAGLEGSYSMRFAHGLLNQPGERSGVVLALVLLLIPVLGFLGQCARIGAVHRDRRLAGLRLAGGTPWQVRRIAAYETGLACLAGSAVATVFAVLLLVTRWRPTATAWAGIALVAVGVPVAGALVGVLALRRVVASPLGWVRRVRAPGGRAPWFMVLGALVGVPVLLIVLLQWDHRRAPYPLAPLTVWVGVVLTGLGAVALSGLVARLTGRRLAGRTSRPAVLIAAERLSADPWAAARTHAAALLVTVVGTGFVGVRAGLLDALHASPYTAEDMAFYTTGLDLTAAAIAVGLVITLGALAVGAAESLATRRRGLAAQSAAGVPRAVLGRALLLETALPLAPALLLAGAGGLAVGVPYAALAGGPDWSVPWASLLVPVGVYAGCLIAAATALPLLGRAVRPGELRYG
ncbi:ABC transporter permease [Streptomyces sp. NPDC048290]|uniref:ABC transporter permease n=1 Tax=Streptomyces sp. NPDC048290 TaxID=3155811 RepID=UPI003412D16F